MKSDHRMMSLLTAAVASAVLASALLASALLASPASAAENATAVTDVSAKAASAIERRHGPSRIALSRYVRHVSAVPRNFDCTGAWCGRHFVLILGIGY
jgi:hypothetical protein